MIHLTRALIRRWLDALLHIDDTPERTAGAFALGVYSNLPWFLAPYYAFVIVAGTKITGHRVPPGFQTQFGALFEHSLFAAEFWHRLITLLKPLLWPYAVGSMIGAIVLGALAYPLALAFVTSRRRIHDIMSHHHKHESDRH